MRFGELVNDLVRNALLNTDKADAMALVLTGIAGSVDKVYREFIPRLLSLLAENKRASAQEALWDIREAFRHID